MRVGAQPLRRRPATLVLRGFRLFRTAVRATVSLVRLTSPSLPDAALRFRLRPTFAGLAVLRDDLTSAGSSLLRSFVLSTTEIALGTQQISLGKTIQLCSHPGATTTKTPTNTGRRRWRPTCPLLPPYGALLSLNTATHTYDFHQTSPRGPAAVWLRAVEKR